MRPMPLYYVYMTLPRFELCTSERQVKLLRVVLDQMSSPQTYRRLQSHLCPNRGVGLVYSCLFQSVDLDVVAMN